MKFYLGTHQPGWLETVAVPWFVSVRRLLDRKRAFPNHVDWIMDSGGFTELSLHGKYVMTEDEYVEQITRFKPRKAFCQDWMCESFMLEKTGLTVKEHQERTIKSYIGLVDKSFYQVVAPVLQGYTAQDYVAHVDMHRQSGVNMTQLFGVGSVCRRNGSPDEVLHILRSIHAAAPGISLHGFGLKTTCLSDSRVCELLYSADSMAWSLVGRKMNGGPNGEPKVCDRLGWSDCQTKACGNCMEFALLWRQQVLRAARNRSVQLSLVAA